MLNLVVPSQWVNLSLFSSSSIFSISGYYCDYHDDDHYYYLALFLFFFFKLFSSNQEKFCSILLSPCLLIQVSCQKAKENFELALEADNSNAHARYWLSKLHLKYHVPGACKAM